MAATYSALVFLAFLVVGNIGISHISSNYCLFGYNVAARTVSTKCGRLIKMNSSVLPSRPITRYNKHGYQCLFRPFKMDLTIDMDIERNPGPDDYVIDIPKQNSEALVSEISNAFGSEYGNPLLVTRSIVYTREELHRLRAQSASLATPWSVLPGNFHICPTRSWESLQYRGCRAGRKVKERRSCKTRNIPIHTFGPRLRSHGHRSQRSANLVTARQLIPLKKVTPPKTFINNKPNDAQFPVPKFLFINACSLTKVKNNIRGTTFIEADLHIHDIDVCVVSETHLRCDIPDSAIHINNYTAFRRDRGWNNNDNRKNGGVAIYVRNNLKVCEVNRAERFEVLSVQIKLPSENRMLIVGTYHPPKPNYDESLLRIYLSDLMDDFLNNFPDGTVVCGGDLNQLNIEELESMIDVTALVDFPTRKESTLDNCLTNRPSLFEKCYPVNPLIKTDHKGVVLPAGTKLKPIRYRRIFRDYRHHRKAEFNEALEKVDWSPVLEATDVNTSVNNFQDIIHNLMNKCFTVRTVKMSTRDPVWMTPLLKSLLNKRNKRRRSGDENSLSELNKRISEIILENKDNLQGAKIGTKMWWKKIDDITNRKKVSRPCLEEDAVTRLNQYFGKLCFDEDYVEPIDVAIDNDTDIPQLTELQVFHALSTVRQTATGPDQIPYWVWKDFADLLTPVIHKCWNLSLRSCTWPQKWKESNINPLAKVDIPTENSHYRGINITPIIARLFEKTVYKTHCINSFEKYLCNTQFAYRRGGSCSNALIKFQHNILSALDNPDCKAVRVFSMDFSKAFDVVKHSKLSEKLKSLSINPYLINWYHSFLYNRRQRVICNGYVAEWKQVNRGTTQGSVSGPYLFSIFINDLVINDDTGRSSVLVKYADDTTIISPVWQCNGGIIDNSSIYVKAFLNWTNLNGMACNTSKCKEISFRKKHNNDVYSQINQIPQCNELKLLGLTFQSDNRFNKHVKEMLSAINKGLFVIRGLRKEGATQLEVDHLFKSIVMPKLRYGLSVYGSSGPELTTVQNFLDRCHKRRYILERIDIVKILEETDVRLFKKIENSQEHPLFNILPSKIRTKYNLRNCNVRRPMVKTERYKNAFRNRLIFLYNLGV